MIEFIVDPDTKLVWLSVADNEIEYIADLVDTIFKGQQAFKVPKVGNKNVELSLVFNVRNITTTSKIMPVAGDVYQALKDTFITNCPNYVVSPMFLLTQDFRDKLLELKDKLFKND